jgi:hypothetical protein
MALGLNSWYTVLSITILFFLSSHWLFRTVEAFTGLKIDNEENFATEENATLQ